MREAEVLEAVCGDTLPVGQEVLIPVPRQATFALSLQRHMRGTIYPRRGGWVRRAGPSSGALVAHCHDRNRSFDLSPSLAALVRT